MFFILDSQCGNSNLYVQGFQLSKHSSPSMIYFLCLFLNPVLFLGFKFQLTGTGVCSVGNPLYFPRIPQVYVLFSLGIKRLCLSLSFTFEYSYMCDSWIDLK